MNTISDQLRSFSQAVLIDRLEIYKRLWIFPRYFLSQFKEDQLPAASEAVTLLVQKAFRKEEEYYILIAKWLEGQETMPPFINSNRDKWMRSVCYLAFGDEEFEDRMDPSVLEYSKSIALRDVKTDLDNLLLQEVAV